jgi:acetolactate synthase regulatory subunit
MKSVKEISEELEVSKQTVFNNIKRLNIETVKQDNTSFIKNDVDVEKIIQRVIRIKKKYGFESANVSSEKVKTDNNKKNESKYDVQIIELLEKQIDTLNKQLEKQEKRHETTIEFYRKELQERSKLLENQQVLALESTKKIQRLESELEEERQLNYSANKRQDIEVQETMENMDSINNDSDSQKEKMVSHFRDESKDKHEDKQQDSELQQGNKIDGEQKEDIRNENHLKKSFWSKLFGNLKNDYKKGVSRVYKPLIHLL